MSSSMSVDPPESYLCPIGREVMRDPVACSDGHSYDRVWIEDWFRRNCGQPSIPSPLTNLALPSRDLIPNLTLRGAIEEWNRSTFGQVPSSAIELQEEIGRGSFKVVFKATFRGKPVAVQKIAAHDVNADVSNEASLYIQLGRHPHLLRYYGKCVESNLQMLIMEFAPEGSLHGFMEKHDNEFGMQHKLTILRQICGGLKYIAELGVIHCDVAARNVFVFDCDVDHPDRIRTKLGDLGLGIRKSYHVSHMTYHQHKHLPFRWMPPESMLKRRFSEKSDVWAFGVMAWEVFSWGGFPYPLVQDDEAVGKRVCSGERLEKPEDCSIGMWKILHDSCWAHDAYERPTFERLEFMLNQVELGAREEQADEEEQVRLIHCDDPRDISSSNDHAPRHDEGEQDAALDAEIDGYNAMQPENQTVHAGQPSMLKTGAGVVGGGALLVAAMATPGPLLFVPFLGHAVGAGLMAGCPMYSLYAARSQENIADGTAEA